MWSLDISVFSFSQQAVRRHMNTLLRWPKQTWWLQRKESHLIIHLYCVGSLHVQAQGETPLSKEQEAKLMQQTLAALGEMRIRYPGKSEEEAEAVLDEVSYAAERKRSVRAGRPAALFPSFPELIWGGPRHSQHLSLYVESLDIHLYA